MACEKGQLKDVQCFIEIGKMDVNIKGKKSNHGTVIGAVSNQGLTGLMVSLRCLISTPTKRKLSQNTAKNKVLKYLLSLPKVDVSIVDENCGKNALHFACQSQNLFAIAELLKHP